MLILCLAAIALVTGDVSHLQGGSNGYDYPKPAIRFEPETSYLPPPPPPPRKYCNITNIISLKKSFK